WITETIKQLNNHRFPNSLKGIQDELVRFKNYRTQDKPPKYKEKGELEALFFTIQTKRKAMGRKPYIPPEGLFMHDIETRWDELDRAEHDRQNALAAELQRQERLEQLARKFERKAKLRESWLREMTAVLQDVDFGRTAAQVEASVKKHEAISTDIIPRDDRFKTLSVMAADLVKEHYHDSDRVRGREREILDKWAQLLHALEQRRKALMSLNDLMTLLRDIDTLSSEFSHIEPSVRSRDMGKHILGVDDLLQKHSLVEAQINAQGEWLKNVTRQSHTYIRNKGEQYEILQRKLDELTRQYEGLLDLAKQRRIALERARELCQFIQDHEEEESWLAEKRNICVNMLSNRDLAATPQLTRLFKNLEVDMQGHWQRSKQVIAAGEKLLPITQPQSAKEEVQQRIASLQKSWADLRELTTLLGRWLREAEQAAQYFQDANEAESWIREKMPLVRSDDYGRDEKAAETLLNRHMRLEEEIQAYRSDMTRLDEMAAELAKAEFLSDAVSSDAPVHKEIEEVVVPQVTVLYPYDGNGVSVEKDEILALIQKTNADWWRILKADGAEGFVPANYVEILEGQTVTVAQPVTVEKKEEVVVKEKAPSASGKNPILERQEAISADYRRLNNLAQTRRRLLGDAIKLYRFYRECDEFEVWAKQTDVLLNEDTGTEHVEASRRKFNKLETDIAANGGTRIKLINVMADELTEEGHSQSNQIRRRQKEVNDIWNRLQRHKESKAEELETAERVAAFNEMCEETRSWMRDKFDLLDQPTEAKDLKALQALQRRHQNLERELNPVDAKMKHLRDLANQVKGAHPAQAGAIDKKYGELSDMWEELKRQAEKRRRELEESQGQQMFQNAYSDLMTWVEKTKILLNDDTKPVDVNTAEDLLKKHYDLKDNIAAKDDEFAYVNALGLRLLDKNKGALDVKDALRHLSDEQRALRDLWAAKEHALKDQLELQLFNREADYIDAATKGHEAFLDIPDLGDSVEGVENLLKRHGDFEAKLAAQEERLEAFSANADHLISNGHSESPYIDQRRRDVIERRRRVKETAAVRRANLGAALDYQNFRRYAQEMTQWIVEKKRIATDESYKDGTALNRKLQKHEAFEAELKANADRLSAINKDGTDLINHKHYASGDVKHILKDLNDQWAALCRAAAERGEKLRQACDQKSLNLTLDDAHLKLNEMERALQSDDLGHDLRGVKDLIQKHTVLEQEMTLYDRRIKEIVDKGKKMADQGHFDSNRILNAVKAFTDRFNALQAPAARRRAALEESRKWHQLAFDVDCELQWIAEKRPIAASKDVGRSLTDATNLVTKHAQLEAEVNGHEHHIGATLAKGDELISAKHYAKDDVIAKCDELRNAWKELNTLTASRHRLLDLALKGQQYLFDAAEVESWMAEKRNLLASDDYGQDEDAANKLLAKHKALQADMNAYKTWIEKLSKQCTDLQKAYHSDSARFVQKQSDLEAEFERLSQLADDRRRHLEDAVCLYQYMRESQELEAWINEQLQTAMSEEYGQDYEHLKELQNKFEEFKQSVKNGSNRFALCETAANNLLKRSPPFSRDILQRQEQLRAVWSLLLDYIESRDHKLDAAEELHRFNRDVAENEERIQEKRAAIPEDLGRDIKQVHSLWLKHEAFENELVAMGQQLQGLLEESARLKAAYPGGNAEHITEQQTALAESWQDLQDATAFRHDRLRAAYDLQRFLASARDLIAWTDIVVTEMQSEQPIKDLQGAEWLHKEHARLRAEVEAREPEFSKLATRAQQMIAKEHYASEEIKDKQQHVDQALRKVNSEWELREQWLRQLVQWHAFQREAAQTLAVIAARESTLRSAEVGGSVEDVDSQIRKLDTFQRIVTNLEERVAALEVTADQLIKQRHMEANSIDQLRRQVKAALNQLKDHVLERKAALADALLYARFNSDVAEMDNWIVEKQTRIRAEAERHGQLTSLEDKMKRLQKHQAFEAELAANEPRVEQIKVQASELQRKPRADKEIPRKCQDLLSRWKELAHASHEQSRALEEARDLLNFNQLVERVMAWIRDKELMVHAGDMGKDYEHCQSLLKRLDDAESDVSVDEQTLKSINDLGEKLVTQGRSSREEVQAHLADLNQKWKLVQSDLADYRRRLLAASEVHSFNRDVDDTNHRIFEKATILSSDDFGKDLHSVDALLRKQDEIERDMTAIHEKLRAHDNEAQILLAKKPPLEDSIIESLRKLEASWDRLTQLAHTRRDKLQQSSSLHKYFDAVKKSEQWSNAIRTKMTSYAAPKSVPEAQALIDAHKDKLAEIDGRQEDMSALREWGQRLTQEQPDHKGEIQRAHKRLQSIEHQIRQTWEQENTNLWRAYDLQLFNDQVLVAETWLAGKEAFLKQEDLGDSLDSVDSLLKKHDGFESTLNAQSDKIDQLRKDAETLAEKNADNREEIHSRKDEVVNRHKALLAACRRRRGMLEDSRKWQNFLKTCAELMSWVNAKLQLAYDESFLDPTNLRSKLQKHLAFDAELHANQGRLDGVIAEGEGLIKQHHFAKDDVKLQLNEINSGWDELKRKSALKADRLKEAYEAHLFNRKLEDLDKWLDSVEHRLASEDHGRDLQSTTILIKRHEALEAEIAARKERVAESNAKASELAVQGHFMTDELSAKARSVDERYASLQEPCQIRRENLRDAHALYQWMHEVEEETAWMREKLPPASSTDYGDTLQAVQSLHRKHLALEQELTAKQPVLDALEHKGNRMLAAKHFASLQIQQIVDDLALQMLSLKDLAATRGKKLKDALDSQQYYAEASEADQWIRDRLPLVTNQDTGRDQDAADSHLRKLTLLDTEVASYKTDIDRLRSVVDQMIHREHFDATQLTAKQGKLERDYADLRAHCTRRRTQLVDAGRYYGFIRQADDLIQWLKDKEQAAGVEDYGRDLEDCQKLIDQFDQVVRELASAGERVAAVQRVQEELLRASHPYSASIKAKGSDLQQLWSDVHEASTDRQQALLGAKQVHKFDQDADETLNWLQEKEATQVVMEQDDLSQADLAAIKNCLQKHDEFNRGLTAVEKQVNDLCKEAERLETQFPDTKDHLEVRRQEMEEQLKDVLGASRRHHDRLTQAEQLQAYFQEYRDLMAWIKVMQATVTSELLPRDVPSCEALMQRHTEYNAEINGHQPRVDEFVRHGRQMISNQHLLSVEVLEKVDNLLSAFGILREVWQDRKTLYDENLDAQMWKRDATVLEAWLLEREGLLGDDWRQAESVEAVDDLIRQFDDFLTTLHAQGEKFESLKKLTLLEQAFSNLRQKETERFRQDDDTRRERSKTKDQIKTVEKHKILQERRQERERRKTQEISLLKPSLSMDEPQPNLARRESEPRIMIRPRAGSRGTKGSDLTPSTASESASFDSQSHATKTTPSEGDRLVPANAASASSTPVRQGSTRRTPTFTTRRAHSLRRVRQWDDLASIDMHGHVDRKQQMQSGGKKATIRSWKNYYTILCGQLLCFFKDEDSFMENMAAAPPVYILGARCALYPEYHKRRHAFKLLTQDGAEYLFATADDKQTNEWVAKISFHASLEPSNQLKSFENAVHPQQMTSDAPTHAPPPRPSDAPRRHTTDMATTYSVREPAQMPSPQSKKDDSGVFSPRDVNSPADGTPAKGVRLSYIAIDTPPTRPPPPPPPKEAPTIFVARPIVTESTVHSRSVRQEYRSVYNGEEKNRQTFVTNVFTCGSGATNGHTNGHTNGTTNGTTNGKTNGISNGNGVHLKNGDRARVSTDSNGHDEHPSSPTHSNGDSQSRGAFRARYEAALLLSKGSATNGSNGHHEHSSPLNGNGTNGHHDYSDAGHHAEHNVQQLSYSEQEMGSPNKSATLPSSARDSSSPSDRFGSLSSKPVPPPRGPKTKQTESDFVAWVEAHGQAGAQGQSSPAMSDDGEKKKSKGFVGALFKRSIKRESKDAGK
uniref:Spectrin alpha chain n=1 Tax=Plectus sambesii TaxID=2011161 RepID=A0A914XIB6_9BILA